MKIYHNVLIQELFKTYDSPKKLFIGDIYQILLKRLNL